MWVSRSEGFTLVELLVVMVLIGLLSGLIFTSVGSSIFKTEEKRFVQDFLQGLNRARAASLGRGTAVRFVIDGTERTFYMDAKKKKKIPEGVQIEGEGIAEFGENTFGIIFFPDASSSGGELDLKLGDGQVEKVTVSRLLGVITSRRES